MTHQGARDDFQKDVVKPLENAMGEAHRDRERQVKHCGGILSKQFHERIKEDAIPQVVLKATLA